jgi:hypothetical protein
MSHITVIATMQKRERGVFIWINSLESPFVCVSAGGLAMLLLPSSFACVRATVCVFHYGSLDPYDKVQLLHLVPRISPA